MNEANQKMSAHDIEALLPWYAAGTLDAHEANEVEAAVAADTELARRLDLVREEMNETIVLNEALGAPSPRVMENLLQIIDRERRTARAPAAGLGAWLMDLLSPRNFAFAAGAAVVVIMLQAGVIAKLVLENQGAAGPSPTGSSYDTASAPSPTRSFEFASFALVRFAPQANMADVNRFLDARDARIVDGPRPGGVYRVRIATGTYLDKEALERTLKDFQSARNLVIMAMPE